MKGKKKKRRVSRLPIFNIYPYIQEPVQASGRGPSLHADWSGKESRDGLSLRALLLTRVVIVSPFPDNS